MRRLANHQSKTSTKKMVTPNKKADFFERVNLHFIALRFSPRHTTYCVAVYSTQNFKSSNACICRSFEQSEWNCNNAHTSVHVRKLIHRVKK